MAASVGCTIHYKKRDTSTRPTPLQHLGSGQQTTLQRGAQPDGLDLSRVGSQESDQPLLVTGLKVTGAAAAVSIAAKRTKTTSTADKPFPAHRLRSFAAWPAHLEQQYRRYAVTVTAGTVRWYCNMIALAAFALATQSSTRLEAATHVGVMLGLVALRLLGSRCVPG